MNSCLVENGGWILHGASYLLDLLEPRWVGLPQGPDQFLWQLADEILSFEKCLKWGGNGARSPWQFSRRWGGGRIKGARSAHTWNFSPNKKKRPPHGLQMPRAAPEMAPSQQRGLLRRYFYYITVWAILHAFVQLGYDFVFFCVCVS